METNEKEDKKENKTTEQIKSLERKEKTQRLCNGEKLITDRIQSQLKCFLLNTTEIPFLRLTRIKIEELFKRPQILLIHDFLSENQIQIIQSLAKSSLNRSMVFNDGTQDYSELRIGEESLIRDRDVNGISIMEKTIGAIMRSNMETAGRLKVMKYGIGGYFDNHFDSGSYYEGNDAPSYNSPAVRIVTWINYLNDVEAGGLTVFPELNVSVIPKKSSAIFWFNLFKSGKNDEMTIHCGCPVLLGTKWIATKWINIEGQELTKPCAIDRNELNNLS